MICLCRTPDTPAGPVRARRLMELAIQGLRR